MNNYSLKKRYEQLIHIQSGKKFNTNFHKTYFLIESPSK